MKTERISDRRLAFGKSVKPRAPSLFVSNPQAQRESAGARVIEFAMSQLSHDTGDYVRKSLSQRFHMLADGSRVHRDLYSVWPARFVGQDRLDTSRRAAAEPLLQRASGFSQSASGTGFPHPRFRRNVAADRPLTRVGLGGTRPRMRERLPWRVPIAPAVGRFRMSPPAPRSGR
jgi:putative transposase